MSDTGRQSFTDKAGSAMKPDSQKGTFEQAGDAIKGKMDSAASTMQPNASIIRREHWPPSVGDMVSSNSNQNQDSLLNKAKNAVGMGDNTHA
ncbi:hypothetical protein NLJ89_g5119 [Agrocybe chaxingu]|uniref:Uncharacterized protein n=1 Tax=Agrocybe chaxingu TaxID=84603 RepID=A0A9W8K186_9AGAR|nr:hypothetical protein NLJ89_g5119 [Agrocybe chaxingu]